MTDRITFAGTAQVEGRRIRGYVQLAGSRTFRNGEWLEVDPAALVRADASNVTAAVDHDLSKVLGRTTNGTLTLKRTEDGIEYETAELPNTTAANDALELAKGGFFGGSSFSIEGLRSTFATDPDGTRVRRITSIARLVDVSPVYDPAFVNSRAAAFSKESTVTAPAPEPIEEPTAPPAAPEPKAAPKAAFAQPKDDKSDTYRTAEKFAREKPLADIEGFMDNLISKGEMSPAERDQYDAFAQVYDERKATDREARERQERIELAHKMRRGLVPKGPAESGLYASDDYTAAFSSYIRSGNPRLMEQFAQSVAGDGSQGGFTVPDGFLNRITERLKAFGGIAGIADEITTSTGESLRWPTNDDTGNTAAIAAEGTAGTAGADLEFGSVELGAFSYNSNGTGNAPLKVSLELIQDAAFDIAGLVERKLGQRIGRKQAVHLATGQGGTEPVGLLSKSADAMTATVVSLAAPEHIFQVDSEYRDQGNCRWVMSDTTLAKAWTSQTTTNQPLFIPGGATINGKPADSLYGYPISIDPAAGNLVAFGDIRLGYIIRRVRGVQILVDPYSAQSTRQIAYHAWARMDANIQDSFAYSVSTWSGVSADT